jgi:hypothetical protein
MGITNRNKENKGITSTECESEQFPIEIQSHNRFLSTAVQNVPDSTAQMDPPTTGFHVFVFIFIAMNKEWMDLLKYFVSPESTSCGNNHKAQRWERAETIIRDLLNS